MPRPIPAFFASIWLVSTACLSGQVPDFLREVQPIFSEHCLSCHGPEKQKSGYRLDEKAVALQGGDAGEKAIVPGRGLEGGLMRRITSTNQEDRMPPKGPPVPAAQVEVLRRWIEAGAPWPESNSSAAGGSAAAHWSFQPVRRPAEPVVRNRRWVRNPIDSFVLARLEKERWEPAPEADRPTLLRRLQLDLLGLPPAPEEVEEFVKDRRPDAYERLVDRLLASPHFGERWGRHWLDLARYADSAGYQIDRVRPGAYLYRDWVVDSFNRDQPFDQFTLEQLAGDLLPEATVGQKTATGFHRMTLSNHEDGVDAAEFDSKAKVDRVSTTGTAWLGLTVGCAECHSHKYDPISQREFYQLYSFFNASEERDLPSPNPAAREKFEQERKAWQAEKARLETERDAYSRSNLPLRQLEWERTVKRAALPASLAEILALPAARRTAAQKNQLARHFREQDAGLKEFTGRLKAHQRRQPKPREEQLLTMAARSNAPITRIHVRGDFLRPGEEVRAGFIRALSPGRRESWPEHSTRLDLARWIVSPENPLTARVAVNHLWLHLFGRGLVNTPEDFGTRGDAPSHPELLDWLADEFLRQGWSRKALIRLIVTSATYRQSSRVREELLVRDPQNVLLARQNRFRVESEIVRDLFLSASGLLDDELGGPGIYPPIPEDVKAVGYGSGGEWVETAAPQRYRRGLYVANRRTVPYPVAMTFDQANPNDCVARRERSTTPLQPLALLNNPFFAECAAELGRRMEQMEGRDRTRLDRAFQWCLSRPPTRAELNRLERLVRDERQLARASEPQVWRAVADVLLNLEEFTTRE